MQQQQHKEVDESWVQLKVFYCVLLNASHVALYFIFHWTLFNSFLSVHFQLVVRLFFYRCMDFTIQSYRFLTLDAKFSSRIVIATIHFINFLSALLLLLKCMCAFFRYTKMSKLSSFKCYARVFVAYTHTWMKQSCALRTLPTIIELSRSRSSERYTKYEMLKLILTKYVTHS